MGQGEMQCLYAKTNEKLRLAVLKFSLKILRYHMYIPVFKENFALQYSFLICFKKGEKNKFNRNYSKKNRKRKGR